MSNRFGFGLLAAVSVAGALSYGDSFWYLLAAVFVVLSVCSRAQGAYEIEEAAESASVVPDDEDGESVVVSRVSRRRRA